MTRDPAQHLKEEEFDPLLAESLPAGGTDTGDVHGYRDALLSHIAICGACEQKLSMYRIIHNRLKALRGIEMTSQRMDCPDNEQWLSVASGVIPQENSKAYLEHAASCQRCGQQLSDAVAELSDEPTSDEKLILERLESQTASWPSRLVPLIQAQRGTGQPRRQGLNLIKRFFWIKPAVLTFSTVLLVGAVALMVILRRPQATSADELVARAYTDNRTFELRIKGASYGPLRGERGGGRSIIDRPRSLFVAIQNIQDGLSKNPNDPYLLDAKAKIDLLNREPQGAIESLNKARETMPDSQSIMTDLATAYAMRAEQANSDIDLGRALDLLGKVLARDPHDTVALFNRAIAAEHLHLNSVAIEDWTTYVAFEKDIEWRREGQVHLERLRQIPPKTGRLTSNPDFDVAIAQSRLNGAGTRSAVDDEGYLNDELLLVDAIEDGLPKIASQPLRGNLQGTAKITDSLERMRGLSRTLSLRHHDNFLADILSSPNSGNWKSAIQELAAAARANEMGNLAEILTHSQKSIRLFHVAHNPAGEAAATFQYLSGINRLQMADRCGQIAFSSLKRTGIEQYPWIQINLLFESSTCDFMSGHQEAALEAARRAKDLSVRSHYKILALQGDWMLDGVATPWVATTDSWNRIRAGLNEFWRLPYPAFAGDGFYSDLGYAAQAEGLWHCAEAVFRESIVIHTAQGDRSVIAAAHHLLAKAAEAAGETSIAEGEYRVASELLNGLGKGSGRARVELAIERAAVQVRQDRLDAAFLTLRDISPDDLKLISNHYARIPYLTAQGELDIRAGRFELAEQELLSAIRMIEQDKGSLHSQTDVLTWRRDTSQAYRSLIRLYLDKYHDNFKAFSLLEWYRSPNPRSVASSHNGTEFWRAAQSSNDHFELDGRTGILTWISFRKDLYIFLLDKEGLHTVPVNIDNESLTATIQKLVRLCADPMSDLNALNGSAHRLYEWLIQPVSSRFDQLDRLIIEPDDSLWAVPFKVLRTRESKYLGQMFPIIESPGIAYADVLRKDREISAQSAIMAVGDPFLSGDAAIRYGQLPAAAQEVSNIAAKFKSRLILTRQEATAEAVMRSLPGVDIFHFAGHALSGSNETGLVLSSSNESSRGFDLLNEKRLEERRLRRTKLVILSGCETGVADHGLADPESIVREFLRAGVPNVVASKWRIDSQTSADFMESTYKHLLHGAPIETAVFWTEQSFRSNNQTAHPYYWAPFSVFGGEEGAASAEMGSDSGLFRTRSFPTRSAQPVSLLKRSDTY